MTNQSIATIGHNGGEPIDPMPALQIMLADLVTDIDSLTSVTNAAQCEAARSLLGQAKDAAKAVKEAKEREKRPHLDANKAFDEAYRPLLTACDKLAERVDALLTPYLKAERDKADALAKAKREEAAALEAAALDAHKSDDMQTVIDAELLIGEAKLSKITARKLEGKAKGFRTYYEADVTDYLALGKWAWQHRNEQYKAFLLSIADSCTRSPADRDKGIPGVTFIEKEKAI
jgi:hypothetical protein